MTEAKTTLVIGKSEPERQKLALKMSVELLGDQTPKFDILVIDALAIMSEEERKSVGIEHSRNVIRFIKDKPLQHPCKVVLILEAQYLTPDAGNALLKTLEEPPANTYLVLTAPQKDSLLPTIVSRCRLVNLGSGEQNEPTVVDPAIFTDHGMALDWLATNKELLEEKESIFKLLDSWESHLRDGLLTNIDRTTSIERLWNLRQTLMTTTTSPRLAIEEFLLKQ